MTGFPQCLSCDSYGTILQRNSTEGKAFGFTPGQAATYAMNRIGFLEKEGRQLDPQLFLDLKVAIERTTKTVPA
jgi:hypothetical protein